MALLTALSIGLMATVVGVLAGRVLGEALALTLWGSEEDD